MPIEIVSDGVLEAFSDKVADMDNWLPDIFADHLPDLGAVAAEIMEGLVEPNRYTGALQSSIISLYDPSDQSVAIYPTADRNGYDAGVLLELGVPHPVAAPWAPIKAWAEARGLPAFPVWRKIREEGIAAHPFLQRTADDGATATAMQTAALQIVTDAALAIIEVGPVTSASIEVES